MLGFTFELQSIHQGLGRTSLTSIYDDRNWQVWHPIHDPGLWHVCRSCPSIISFLNEYLPTNSISFSRAQINKLIHLGFLIPIIVSIPIYFYSFRCVHVYTHQWKCMGFSHFCCCNAENPLHMIYQNLNENSLTKSCDSEYHQSSEYTSPELISHMRTHFLDILQQSTVYVASTVEETTCIQYHLTVLIQSI